MAAYIEAGGWPLNGENIKREKARMLVPEEELKWIDEGDRQAKWLQAKIALLAQVILFPFPIAITGKDHLIATIDAWNIDIPHKSIELRNLKPQWITHKSVDKKYDWFKDDGDKLKIAWDWLNKNGKGGYHLNIFEKHDDLLSFFDSTPSTPDEIKFYISEIKKKWSREKHRKSLKDKKQYNFILSHKTIERLDKLAAEHEISRAQIIEILVEMETDKGAHLQEKLNKIRLLNKI